MLQFLSFFTTPQSNRALKVLVIIALLLFVAAILVFWFGGSSFTERGVEIKLEGPEQALSGDEVVYKLKYINNTRTPLRNLQFRFFYPENSIVIKDNNEYSTEIAEYFQLDGLEAHSSGEKEFRAFLIGDKGSVLYAKTDLFYQAGDLSSRFEKKPISVATTIIGLPVPLTLSAPPTAVSGQEITYTLDYRNESQGDVANLRFKFTYPDGFTPKRFSPQPSEGTSTWNLATLKNGSGARITITGSISGNERDNKTVSMVLQRKIDASYIDYERAEASTIISSPLMNARIIVNGSRDYIASPGEFLTYNITYKNTSKYTFTGVTLQANLEGEMYDLNTLNPGSGYYDNSTKTIIWSSSGVPSFGSLGPNAGGSVEFRVQLRPTFSGGALGSKNFFIKTSATLATTDIPTGLDGQEISTHDSLVTKISTQPSINESMRYSDPAQGSSGPMPPQVGQKTMFYVTWEIANPGNSVADAIVKTSLPVGVSWENSVTVNSGGLPIPIYNQSKAQVMWNLGSVPSGVGAVVPKYSVTFKVGITPSSTQVNTTPYIVRSGTFTGTDSFTQQSILINLDDLTTSDTLDRSGEGTVVQ